MGAMSQLWSHPGFIEAIKKMQPSQPADDAGGAGGAGGNGRLGGDGNSGVPAGGSKKGVSFDVFNPGDWTWDVISEDKSLDTGNHSAGAIIRGTKDEDYEGWEDHDFTTAHDDKANDVHVTFHVSKRIRGHPKDDPVNNRYVAEVRVSGMKTGLGGLVSARVEGARAIWSDVGDCAAVTFTIVIVIKAGPKKGRQPNGSPSNHHPRQQYGDRRHYQRHPRRRRPSTGQ